MKTYETKKPKKVLYDLSGEREKKKKEKKKRRLTKSAVAACILVPCLIFGTVMVRGYVRTNRAYANVEKEYKSLAMNYVSEDKKDGSSDKNMAKKVDFKKLKSKEKDIYAWIYMPGSVINYPILQSGDDRDEDYWLNHNMDGTSGYPGTIFTERMFGHDFKSFNTIIYGHNMKNQTMFGCLHNFAADRGYFKKHEFVYIYTPDMTYKYRIVCVSNISDVHLADTYNGYETEQQRQQFLDYLMASAAYSRDDAAVGIYDSYITLSTCTDRDTARFVVLAKCVDKISRKDYD